MSKPAADALQRIRANHPTATVVERHQSSITADIGNNKRALVSTIGAMHYDDNGWQEIDTTWQPSAGAWQYEMTTAPYQASARDAFNVGEVVEYRTRAGEWVRFQPLSLNWRDSNGSTQQIGIPQAVATAATDDVLSWPNGYGPGRSFEWRAHPTRLQKILTVNAPSDLPAPTVAGAGVELELTFAFTFDASVTAFVDGVAWDRSTTRTTGAAIEFRDAGGSVLWAFETPRAWDSAGAETTGSMSMYRVGNSRHVAVRIPRAFADAATFPLFVDPTVTVDLAAASDAKQRSSSIYSNAGSSVAAGHFSSSAVNFRYCLRYALPVPNGAAVSVSKLTVNASTLSTAIPDMYVLIEEVDDAATADTFTAFETRESAATVGPLWTPAAWVSGTDYDTPDFATNIQANTDRAGWASGQHVNLFVVPTTDVYGGTQEYITAKGYGVSGAPVLYVEYAIGLTLTPDGFVSASGVVDQAAGTTNLHLAVDDSPDTSDADTTYLVNSASADGHAWLTLSDTPGDFGSMNALNVRVRVRRE